MTFAKRMKSKASLELQESISQCVFRLSKVDVRDSNLINNILSSVASSTGTGYVDFDHNMDFPASLPKNPEDHTVSLLNKE